MNKNSIYKKTLQIVSLIETKALIKIVFLFEVNHRNDNFRSKIKICNNNNICCFTLAHAISQVSENNNNETNYSFTKDSIQFGWI